MQLLLLVLAAAAVAAASAARDSLRYEAPEDCQWSPRTSDEVALNCSLRTINSEFDHTNFSIIPAEHTTSLVVNCDSEVELKSTLPEDAFAHLIRLKELTLEQCKLPKWPSGSLQGLVDLRNLTIHTGNRKWPLEINAGSFKTIRLLEKLDLSQNNLWSLPEGLFCPLVSLVSLNVTHNRLQEIAELGFQVLDASESSTPPPKSRASCGLDVQVLEASHNNFEQLPAKGLGALRRLQELRVTDNEIKSVADKALAGLKNLKVFDVSNKLVALPPGLFKDCVDIRELKLQNNSLGVLAPGLLAGLEHLQLLDLSRNRLSSTWLDSDTFSGLIRLVLLDISYNRITTLNPDFFKDLYTLQILNLEHNLIETLPADTFSPLSNLHTLVLSFNKLANVDPFSFNGLYALSLLSLDNNLFQTLHVDSLRNCTSLQDLNLNGNLLTNVPPALHDMRLLRTVDLGENSIEQLESPAFKGMDNLYGLRLIGNQISNLTRRSFADLPALQILNLARNNISKIEPSTFDANENLQAIRLDANLLSDMTGLFSKLPALVWLNVSDNQLSWFDYSLVPAGLEYLDLHENKIKEISNAKRRDTNAALKLIKLDVSHNLLTRVGQNSLPNSVELVLLNNNQITTVDVHTFVNKPNLTRVDLYANQIVNMDLNALRLTPVKEERPLPEFYIGGNPFQCDCTMEWLQRINNLDHLRQHPKVMDIESVYCRLPYARDKSFISLIDADSSHFVCAYKTHCFALCHCCDFDACDCEMTCPNNCTCYHDQSWSAANIVDCSLANHVRIPGTIPMDATEVYLDGNSFGELSSHSFIGRKNLRVLYVNGSRVNAIYNHTFSGLRRLEILHLEDNLLKEIKGFELQCLVELKELYLQNNKLQYLDNRTLMELKKLEVVRLDGNRLHNYPVWQLSFNNYLVRITLADNNWSCHCQYMRHFRTWLQQNLAKVSDAARISCVLRVKNEGESISKQLGPKFTDFNNTACSSMLIGGEFLDSEFDQSVTIRALRDYLPFALALLVAVTVASCLIFMAAYHRRELRLWMYSRCGVRLCYRSNANGSVVDEDTNRLFDAYIAYSLKDETWVLQMLATGLEPQYHLCLHYRNFSASSYVADTILEAVESSRRTVLILSPQFLTSEWARFDYKSAMREALQREARKSKKSPRRLIVIFLTDVPSRDLDPDLRMYLNSAALVLKYGDRRFWEKLRSALPAPRTGKNEDPKPRNGTLCCCAAKQEQSAAGARALHLDTSRVVYEYSSMVGPPPPLPDAYEQIGPPSTYHTLRREPPARDLWA